MSGAGERCSRMTRCAWRTSSTVAIRIDIANSFFRRIELRAISDSKRWPKNRPGVSLSHSRYNIWGTLSRRKQHAQRDNPMKAPFALLILLNVISSAFGDDAFPKFVEQTIDAHI